MTTTERTPSEHRVVWLLVAGVVWIFGLGAPVAALEVTPTATPAGTSSAAAVAQPPDDGDDSGEEPDDDEEETPDDQPEDEANDDADQEEPEPEPGNVPVIAWIGAAALVLAAIAWAVNVARD